MGPERYQVDTSAMVAVALRDKSTIGTCTMSWAAQKLRHALLRNDVAGSLPVASAR